MTDWRPNWDDSTAYPDRLTDWQWRWEFLRRDEEYQADFARLQSDNYVEFAFMPQTSTELGCRQKYGVGFLYDPSQPSPPLYLFPPECPYGVTFASDEHFKELDEDGVKLMAFDLTDVQNFSLVDRIRLRFDEFSSSFRAFESLIRVELG